jgi:hypothetical protein
MSRLEMEFDENIVESRLLPLPLCAALRISALSRVKLLCSLEARKI